MMGIIGSFHVFLSISKSDFSFSLCVAWNKVVLHTFLQHVNSVTFFFSSVTLQLSIANKIVACCLAHTGIKFFLNTITCTTHCETRLLQKHLECT